MKKNFKKILTLSIVIGFVGTGCAEQSSRVKEYPLTAENSQSAKKIFDQRCLLAGEKIYKQVMNVDGLMLMNLRGTKLNLSDQYLLDDPYGSDLVGDGYIESFFRDFYIASGIKSEVGGGNFSSRIAYQFVEAIDGSNGRLYRYTGVIDEPWVTDKTYLKGYKKFSLNRVEIKNPSSRFGVLFTDISTKEDRDYWIAGSLLQVVDMNTKEILGERVGYMYDPGQGSTAGGRAPWIVAANHSCPSFGTQGASSSQMLQTEKFVEKVLKPIIKKN